jgi:hypothetical protein
MKINSNKSSRFCLPKESQISFAAFFGCATVLLFLIASMGLSQNSNAGGFAVGNGGDVLICSTSAGKLAAGIYARDYLLSNAVTLELRPVKNAIASMKKIQTILTKHSPNLTESLASFQNDWLNASKYEAKHIWEAAPFGLQGISEQDELLSLPDSCKNADGTPNAKQIIVRTFSQTSQLTSKKRLFKYDPDLFAQLDKENPMQLSFLAVHEWLWEISQDEVVNRRIVVFLHQKGIEKLTSTEFRKELTDRGLKGFSPDTPDAVPEVPKECSGPSITQGDFEARFGLPKGPFEFGKLDTNLWTKMDDCMGIAGCDSNWKNSNHRLLKEVAQPSLMFWKKNAATNFPVKIMTPELIENGTFPADPKSALIECALPKTSDKNIHCQFATKGWEIFTSERIPKNEFVFEAKWTRTCFTLHSSFTANEIYYSPTPDPLSYTSRLFISKEMRWPD